MRVLIFLAVFFFVSNAATIALPIEQAKKIANNIIIFIPEKCEVDIEGGARRAIYYSRNSKILSGNSDSIKFPLSVVDIGRRSVPSISGKWPDNKWLIVLFLYKDPLTGTSYVVPSDFTTEFPIGDKFNEINSLDDLISIMIEAKDPCSLSFLSIAVRNSNDRQFRERIGSLATSLENPQRKMLEDALKATPYIDDTPIGDLFPFIRERLVADLNKKGITQIERFFKMVEKADWKEARAILSDQTITDEHFDILKKTIGGLDGPGKLELTDFDFSGSLASAKVNYTTKMGTVRLIVGLIFDSHGMAKIKSINPSEK